MFFEVLFVIILICVFGAIALGVWDSIRNKEYTGAIWVLVIGFIALSFLKACA